jgi:cell division protein FtsI/penicillin-binding protein 2
MRQDVAVTMRARVAAVALSGTALTPLTGCGSPGPADAAKAYLSAWSRGDLVAAADRTSDPASASKALGRFRADLRIENLTTALGHVVAQHGTTTADFTADVRIKSTGSWRYSGRLELEKVQGHWRVKWDPRDIHPQYGAAARVTLDRHLPARAPLLDRTGAPLFTPQPVVNIGLERQRLGTHAAATIAAVAKVLHVNAAGLTSAVAAATPTAFVPVITLRRAAYEKVKASIYSLPGTVFTTDTQLLPPSTGFARALIGTIGPATADIVTSSGGALAAGDVVGLSGLEAALQRRLAGTATTSVVVRAADGRLIDTLKTFPGTTGAPVRTTLDVATQTAAEQALGPESKPAALVAVDIHTGAVLAAANTPDATSFDRAIVGRYPPGSTFKLATAYALLGSGVTPASVIPCPRHVTVDGKVFTNFEGESGGSPTFADDFAHSCNTAFIGAAGKLRGSALQSAATALGIGTPWRLPLNGFSGSFPSPTGAVEQAADAIGQGRVEVSPLALALVAAAIADGTPHPPVLVTDPAQKAAPPLRPLEAGRLTALRAMMRRVVTSGTAAGNGLPAGTFGKTGTAEFGTDKPPKTHAWFVGYRGSIAFAVLVEGGGVGGRIAAPIAARFLRRLG